MNLSEKLAAPSLIVFQLLEQCDLRCCMCYEWGDMYCLLPVLHL
jgi:hypothetical protein